MPQGKNASGFALRQGQQILVDRLKEEAERILSVAWPTGYGKSIGFALAYKEMKERGQCNRLLMVVANDRQRVQIYNDFAIDARKVGLDLPNGVWPFDRDPRTLMTATSGMCEVFVCTIQQVSANNRGGVNVLRQMLMLPGTKWMLGADEFHHAVDGKDWGQSLRSYMDMFAFTLAMSATPMRHEFDTVIPEPSLIVTYREAHDEGAVKLIKMKRYHYEVAVAYEDHVTCYTTDELCKAAGDINGLSAYEEKWKIRYSPQYIQPMFIESWMRLKEARGNTGRRLQMLIRAMSCRHAECVSAQLKSLTKDDGDPLHIDWIGTGDNGRSDDVNRKIVDAFCPPKDDVSGDRPEPTLDVLVQVGMAGEGFDSINVVEIVDLFPSSKENVIDGDGQSTKQFFGRGTRMIPGLDRTDQILYVSIPSDNPLAGYVSESLMHWMDREIDKMMKHEITLEEEQRGPYFPDYPPDLGDIDVSRNIRLKAITFDDPLVKAILKHPTILQFGFDKNNPDHMSKLSDALTEVMHQNALKDCYHANVMAHQSRIDVVVGSLARLMANKSPEINGAVIGRYKKQLNTDLIKFIGKPRSEWSDSELKVGYRHIVSRYNALRGPNV